MTRLLIYAVLLALITPLACLAEPASPIMTPAQYGAELDRLLAATQRPDLTDQQISELLANLPPSWQVQAEQGKFEISAYWLQRDLHQLQEKSDPDLQKSIFEHLRSLRADLDGYEKPPTEVVKQRAILSGILARPEFRDVHGPNWTERLKQWLIERLIHVLGRFIRSSAIPTVG